VTSETRNEAIPAIPTFAETGLGQVDFNVWHALYLPKGAPAAAIDTLNTALAKALDDPDVQQRFVAVGTVPFEPARRSVAAHAALFASDYARIQRLIEVAGIKPGD
jgi:tripartite-type tricarboxylate transporter receptor subunit TctC